MGGPQHILGAHGSLAGESNSAAIGTAVVLPTRVRILDAALAQVAQRGYEGTSLDALAAGLGVRKQTILHHFGSKEALLRAVLARSVSEVTEAVEAGLNGEGTAFDRVEAVVRAVFVLAGRRPELLGLTREVVRLGGSFVDELLGALEPLAGRATAFLRDAVVAGELRPHDARLVLLSGYSTVIGAATEVEILRQLGVAASPRILVRRRRELLAELGTVLGGQHTRAGIGTYLSEATQARPRAV